MMRVALILALSSCVASQSIVCDDGRTCPEGTVCRALTSPDAMICARPDEIAACDGLDSFALCEHATAEIARCYDGVCQPAGCGNLRVDPDEACDDANSDSGDGCSADCSSTEACGNGVVDLVGNETCDNSNQVDHDGCSSTCKLEQPHWQLRTGQPGARFAGMMAYDPITGRVVMFGGTVLLAPPIDHAMWTWDGTGWMPYVGLVPPLRHSGAMSFDGTNIVLHGGGLRDDTWIFDGNGWTEYTGPGPSRREMHRMVYDSKRQRIVMFGGFPAGVATMTGTWEWDGQARTWTQVMTANTPEERTNPVLAYDPIRERVVLTGGNRRADGTKLYDTWLYDGVSWTDVTSTAGTPPDLYNATALFDSASQQIVVFGPCDFMVSQCDVPPSTFLWDGSTWTTTASAPESRRGLAQAVAMGDRALIFGGQDQVGNELGDTWVLDATGWRPPPRPIERSGVAMERHDAAGHVLLFGGNNGQLGNLDDTWLLGPNGWAEHVGSGPPNEAVGPIAYDPISKQILMQGFAPNVQTWLWNGSAWSQRQPAQQPPFTTTIAFDSKRLTMFGRDTLAPATPQTWSWDGATWFKASPPHSPAARMDACVGYDPIRQQLVLFGGQDGSVRLGDTWTYDGVDWTEHVVDNAPLGRTAVRMVWNAARERLVLAGGTDGFDTWEWDGAAWTQIGTPTTPFGRYGFGAAPSVDGTSTLMFGGALPDEASRRDDLWELRWDAVLN
jgi:cysteine-rich repeat protein